MKTLSVFANVLLVFELIAVLVMGSCKALFTVEMSSLEITEYKPNASLAAQKVFSWGDIDNPWLFEIKNLDSLTGMSVHIMIEDSEGETLYEEKDLEIVTFSRNGETICGERPQGNKDRH